MICLTREGQVLYDYSKQVIQTYDSLHNKLQEIKDIVSGTIRVATIYSIGLHDLPPYLKKFLKTYPTVNVHVEYRRANQVYDDVLGNVVDLGLVAYPTKDPRLELVALRDGRLHRLAGCSARIARRVGRSTDHVSFIATGRSASGESQNGSRNSRIAPMAAPAWRPAPPTITMKRIRKALSRPKIGGLTVLSTNA